MSCQESDISSGALGTSETLIDVNVPGAGSPKGMLGD